jgi:AraC-like DNA-binding protein
MLFAGGSMADTATACEFSDQSHFTRHFKKAFGVTPKRWVDNLGRHRHTPRTNVL